MQLKRISVVEKTTIDNHVSAFVLVSYIERGAECGEVFEASDDAVSFVSNKRWAKTVCEKLIQEKKAVGANSTLTVSKPYADYVAM